MITAMKIAKLKKKNLHKKPMKEGKIMLLRIVIILKESKSLEIIIQII